MFEYMTQHHNLAEDHVNLSVQTHRGRGIYIREEAELLNKQQQHVITVTPQWVTDNGGKITNVTYP